MNSPGFPRAFAATVVPMASVIKPGTTVPAINGLATGIVGVPEHNHHIFNIRYGVNYII